MMERGTLSHTQRERERERQRERERKKKNQETLFLLSFLLGNKYLRLENKISSLTIQLFASVGK